MKNEQHDEWVHMHKQFTKWTQEDIDSMSDEFFAIVCNMVATQYDSTNKDKLLKSAAKRISGWKLII